MFARLASLAAAALLVGGFALSAQAQTQNKGPQLQYRLSTGGLLAGTFTTIEIPALTIGLNGGDVTVIANSGEKDGRPVTLTGGTIKDFTYKRLQTMIGNQMSVKISIVPVDAAPGKRCRIVLDHAKLDKLAPDSITFKPSETPEFECN